MDCHECEQYPCAKTEIIHKFLKEHELGVRVTLNGCKEFNGEVNNVR